MREAVLGQPCASIRFSIFNIVRKHSTTVQFFVCIGLVKFEIHPETKQNTIVGRGDLLIMEMHLKYQIQLCNLLSRSGLATLGMHSKNKARNCNILLVGT